MTGAHLSLCSLLTTPPPFETGVCDRLAARCGIRAASRDRGPCPPCPDAPPTAPRSRLRVRPADRLSLPPAKPVRAASSCLTRPPCGVEATPLDAVWHGSPHGRARTAQPRRLEERRARTGDMGCASYPPARCAARYRTSAGTPTYDPSPSRALSTFSMQIEAIQRAQCGRCIVPRPTPRSRVGRRTREHEGKLLLWHSAF